MAIKRKRLTPEQEAEAWSAVFLHGSPDYFGSLRAAGLYDAEYVPDDKIKDAWRRLGGLFLQAWRPSVYRPNERPWAETMFGSPKGDRR